MHTKPGTLFGRLTATLPLINPLAANADLLGCSDTGTSQFHNAATLGGSLLGITLAGLDPSRKRRSLNSTIFRSRASVATCLLSMTLMIFGNGSAHALLISGSNYVASGPQELMTADFTTPDGGVSANSYSGLVELVVSGTGQSYSENFNDAFYVYYINGGPIPSTDFPGRFQLTFSTTTLLAVDQAQIPQISNISQVPQAAANYIVYDVDAGLDVSAPYLPLSRNDHTYNFVLDVGTLASQLHFGVSDDIFTDNSGAYSITLKQLARSSIPEPGTLALLGLGLAGIYYQRRKCTV